jgi:hypothetical protein
MKNKTINVKGTEVALYRANAGDYISLTDMLKAKDGDFFISDWLRNRNTVEFLGIWEQIHNSDFNYGGFATIRNQAGFNNYKISVKEWVEQTNAIGLTAKAGRYGGTYAHRDIAFEFGMWISPEFKIYLIREFDRLKSEADMLNVALFGKTAAQWRAANQTAKGNIRDEATLEQLIVLSNMESINALLIRQGISQYRRLIQLNQTAITQITSLLGDRQMRRLGESGS